MERTLPIVDGGRTRTLRTRHEVPRLCRPAGIRSLGTAATYLAPLNGATWADAGRGAAPLAWQSVLRPVEVEYSEGRVARENCALLCYIILVYTVSQRHVHLYLRMHDQQVRE